MTWYMTNTSRSNTVQGVLSNQDLGLELMFQKNTTARNEQYIVLEQVTTRNQHGLSFQLVKAEMKPFITASRQGPLKWTFGPLYPLSKRQIDMMFAFLELSLDLPARYLQIMRDSVISRPGLTEEEEYESALGNRRHTDTYLLRLARRTQGLLFHQSKLSGQFSDVYLQLADKLSNQGRVLAAIECYRQYLEKFSETAFEALARARMDALNQQQMAAQGSAATARTQAPSFLDIERTLERYLKNRVLDIREQHRVLEYAGLDALHPKWSKQDLSQTLQDLCSDSLRLQAENTELRSHQGLMTDASNDHLQLNDPKTFIQEHPRKRPRT